MNNINLTNIFRILVIEDQPNWQERYKSILEPPKYKLESAQSLIDAISKIKQFVFHVTIVDIRLVEDNPQDTGGLDALRLITELDDGTRKLVSTAHGTISSLREAFKEYNVSDFIDKRNLNIMKFSEDVEKYSLESRVDIGERFWRESPFRKIIKSKTAREIQETLAAGTIEELRPFLQELLLGISPCLQVRKDSILRKDSLQITETANKKAARIKVICWSRMLGQAVEIEFGRKGNLNPDSTALRYIEDERFPHFCGVVREMPDISFEQFESPQPKRTIGVQHLDPSLV